VATLRNEVIIKANKDEYQTLVDSYESDIRQVASSLPFIETRHEDLDNQFLQLRKRFDDLGTRLRLSEVAIQYDGGAILMLEAAVLPIASLPSVGPGVNRALVGAAIGVVLGVMLAFAWQYLFPPNSTSKEPENS
jgi:uncharacterized protein involved in exopolysaccharide biosynthesis